MEIDKELLKTNKLYNIIVDQRMLDLLLKFEKRVEANYDYKENTRGVREEIDPDLDNDKCKDVVRWNILQRQNDSMSKTANPSLDQFRRGLALHLDKRLMETILRGNCLSRNLLIRTQQWKDDGAFLVRDLQILEMLSQSSFSPPGSYSFYADSKWTPHNSSQRDRPLCRTYFNKVGLLASGF